MRTGFVKEAAMAAITVRTCHKQRVLEQLRNALDACREVLDAFVSRRMGHAISQAAHVFRPHARDPHHGPFEAPPFDPAGTPSVKFEPLDPNVVSSSIPAFFIGRNMDGLWVAREASGGIGGLFVLKCSAVAFARAHGGPVGCAIILPSERFELDLENEGNPFASYLVLLLRFDRT
jgi:hypothetical protein